MTDARARERAPVAVAPRGVRLEWIDAARGYSVAAVVLAHVVLWHAADPGVPVADVGASLWDRVYSVLGSVRMPVLLAVSGLVVAGRVRAGFRAGGLTVRVARNYYLYVVWLLIYAVFYAVVREPGLPHRVDGPLDVLRQLVVPGTTLWYVFALAVYIAVLGALYRAPAWAVLGGLAVLSVVTATFTTSDQVWSKVPELAVFFAIGVYGSGVLRRLAERASVPLAFAAAFVAAGVTALGRFTAGHDVAGAVLSLARGTAFLVVAVLVVVLAVRWNPVRRLGLALGRQTLPIYVLHPLWIALLIVAAGSVGHDVEAAVLGSTLGAILYPAVVGSVVVALCLAVGTGVRRVGLQVPLFAMPARWSQAFERADARTAEPHER
ncbi:acyltransferase [Cellulomonas composti]|uniref:Acyltransferase 3 domain-containing protein n=1 Tax=Cellulomonas composti TaxID=266130 RepID=A0A511JAZ5_9CELL|nr:acyltransferase [Cellulomonas composti]GEL94959.1 hypothetical protein CCO02nite_16170 [Cellulomonas composti]